MFSQGYSQTFPALQNQYSFYVPDINDNKLEFIILVSKALFVVLLISHILTKATESPQHHRRNMSDYYSVTSGGLGLIIHCKIMSESTWFVRETLKLENRHSAFWIDSELTLRTARLFLSVWLVGTPDGGLMDLLRAPRRTPPGRTGFIPSSLIHTLSWPYVSYIHFSCEPAAAAEFRLAASALSSEKPLQSDNSPLHGVLLASRPRTLHWRLTLAS